MKLFIDIKNFIFDASGIENPNLYFWSNQNGTINVYYPIREIEYDELNELVRNFITNNNLPMLSLDEIDIELFNEKTILYRNFYLALYDDFL